MRQNVKPTQEPVPSSNIKDLFFNSGLLDIWATSLEHKYIDRFGNCHLTAAGMEWIFNELVTKFNISAEQAIASAGYVTIDSFQDGADITVKNQVLRWKLPDGDGEYYRWDGELPKSVPAGSTPQLTGGIGKGAWVSVGDASLRPIVNKINDNVLFDVGLSENKLGIIESEGDVIRVSDKLYYNNSGKFPVAADEQDKLTEVVNKRREITYSYKYANIDDAVKNTPENGKIVISGRHIVTSPINIDKNIHIDFEAAHLESIDYDTDIFRTSRSLIVTGNYTSSKHRLLFNVVDLQQRDDIIFHPENGYSFDCYGVIGGRPAAAKDTMTFSIRNVRWYDCEIAIYFINYRFKKILYNNLNGELMKLKPLTDRSGSNFFNKYYCGGLWINAAGGLNQIAVGSDCVARNIQFTSVDPFTNDAITTPDIEVHFFAVENSGSCILNTHNVMNLVSDKPTDNEGIIARAPISIISNSVAVDAGEDEGTLYTKGSIYTKLIGSTVMFSKSPANNSVQRGAILTSEYIEATGNTFINCGRGISHRGRRGIFSNTYINCVAPVYAALQQDSLYIIQDSETYDNCGTTANLNIGGYKLQLYSLKNPTIRLGKDSVIASFSDSNIYRYSINGGEVIGVTDTTKTQLITLSAPESVISIKDIGFSGVSAYERVIVATADINTLIIDSVESIGHKEFLRIRDRTFNNLIIRDNTLLGTGTAINKTNIQVNGKNYIKNNIGDDA